MHVCTSLQEIKSVASSDVTILKRAKLSNNLQILYVVRRLMLYIGLVPREFIPLGSTVFIHHLEQVK